MFKIQCPDKVGIGCGFVGPDDGQHIQSEFCQFSVNGSLIM